MDRTPRRPTCAMCNQLYVIDWMVPTEIWNDVIAPYYQNALVCLTCFTRRADEILVEWDKDIQLWPTSKIRHLRELGLLDMIMKQEAKGRDDGN